MNVYADANFFTALYLLDLEGTATDPLLDQLRSGKHPLLPVTELLRMKVINAIERLVFESRRGGQWRISPEAAAVAQARFAEHLGTSQLLRRAALTGHDLEAAFESLALRHTAKHGFRTYDVLHVASAIVLKCDTFWSFDERARKLAKVEGLKTN